MKCSSIVGCNVGFIVGEYVGISLCSAVRFVGDNDGARDGDIVGSGVGEIEGIRVGNNVTAS